MSQTKGPKTLFYTSTLILFLGALLPIIYVFFTAIVSLGNVSFMSGFLTDGTRQLYLFENTLVIALGTSALSLFLGAPLAFVLSRVSFAGRSLFLLICPVPLLIPPYVHAISWMHALEGKGIVSRLLHSAGLSSADLYTPVGAVVVMALSYYPLVTLVSYVGFTQTDPDLEEVARLQAGPARTLRSITVSLALPAILSGGLFCFIFALSNFGVPSMLRQQVYSIEVFYRFSNLYQMDRAALYSLPILFLSLIALAGIHRLDRGYRFTIHASTRRESLLTMHKGKTLIIGLILLLHLLSIGLPVSALVTMSGDWDNFTASISNARQDILVSFWSSITAAGLILMIGVILAFVSWGSRRHSSNWMDKFCILSFAFPAAAAGIGLIGIWNRGGPFQWVYSSLLILIAAFFCRYVSFAYKPVSTAMNYIDPSLDESARLADVRWWRRILYVLTPLGRNGLVIAWFLVYIFSLTDLDTVILVHPPGQGTLPVRIFNLLHFGRQEWVGALCLVLIGLTIIPYMVLVLWGSRERYASPGM